MQRHAPLLALALAVLAVGAVLLLEHVPSDAAATRNEGAAPSAATERAPLAPVRSALVPSETAPDRVAALDADEVATTAASAGPARMEIPSPKDRFSHRLHIRLEDPAGWCADARHGWLTFVAFGHEAAKRNFRLDDAGRAEIGLPTRPTGVEEFENLTFRAWAAEAVRIEEGDDETSSTLVLGPAPGARFEWDPNTTVRAGGPIEVVVGSPYGPGVATTWRDSATDAAPPAPLGFPDLPFVAPRPTRSQHIWLRAPGSAWSKYTVGTSTNVVYVRLFRASTLRVLHDGPGHGTSVRVWTGEASFEQPITGNHPLVFGELQGGEVTVRLIDESGEGQARTVHRAEFDLPPGEVIDLDLRRATLREVTGGLRLTLAPGTLPDGESIEQLPVSAWRYSNETPHRWAHAGAPDAWRTVGTTQVAEVLGLEPGLYRIVLHSLGWTSEVEVRAGEVRDVRIEGAEWGAYRLQAPPGQEESRGRLHVTTGEDDVGERTFVQSESLQRPLGTVRTLAAGWYVARLELGESAFESAPFEVRAGAVVDVPLEPLERFGFRLRATESGSGREIQLDPSFWRACTVRDARTDALVTMHLSRHSSSDGEEWSTARIDSQGGLLRFAPAAHEHFDFAPIQEFDPALCRVLEIVGRAR